MKKIALVLSLLAGCMAASPAEARASSGDPAAGIMFHQPSARTSGLPELVYHEPWRPTSHPDGTLLVDHERVYWMAQADGVRRIVSGDDVLGEAGLGFGDAVRMSPEEERCTPADDFNPWWPPNTGWWAVYGPGDDDTLYVLNAASLERRITSEEAERSWGRDPMWIDWFDGPDSEWDSYSDVDPPFPMRDSTLVHTELGYYLVVHGRSFYFWPQSLVEETGYHPESALELRDARLREVAPAAFTLERTSFEQCPADDVP
ncbi:MAG TPA: hypothetical protein VMU11_02220 [Verrucomicrobiae bacterium]|nr:hypothetical protein [Verrucomicrobiae bacterium]